MNDSTVNASKEVKRLKEELDNMIKKKLEIESELARCIFAPCDLSTPHKSCQSMPKVFLKSHSSG